MNMLEFWAFFEFMYLSLCVRAARKWMGHVQPWTVLDWGWVVFYGIGLIGSTIFLLDDLLHPASIRPVPTSLAWVVWGFLAIAISGFLVRLSVNIGRRIRQLGRQP